MASSASAAGPAAAPRDLIDVVDEHLPAWREHRARRTLAANWPTRTASIGGRDVELFSLPAVGTTWYARDGGYWWRRISRAVLMVVAVLAQLALDVGVAVAAAGARPTVVVVLVVLALGAALLYWRPDLLAARRSRIASPLPMGLRVVGVVIGGLGAAVTPVYALGLLLDLLPRFPVQERVAWDFLVHQLGRGDAAVR